jgi:ankyrin repeat protein
LILSALESMSIDILSELVARKADINHRSDVSANRHRRLLMTHIYSHECLIRIYPFSLFRIFISQVYGTALYAAAKIGREDVAQALLNLNADPRIVDQVQSLL